MNSDTPVHRIRCGHVQAEVWQNESPSGIQYSVTFGRLYHVGDNWKSYPARIFGTDELQWVAEVAVLAREWIAEQADDTRDLGTPPAGAAIVAGLCSAEE